MQRSYFCKNIFKALGSNEHCTISCITAIFFYTRRRLNYITKRIFWRLNKKTFHPGFNLNK